MNRIACWRLRSGSFPVYLLFPTTLLPQQNSLPFFTQASQYFIFFGKLGRKNIALIPLMSSSFVNMTAFSFSLCSKPLVLACVPRDDSETR